jgi:tRNA dimethylallyltransferase
MALRIATPLIVIAGATGIGKTRLAVELCKRLNGEIVGADSMQVYRGFDIGSAKPSGEELAGVRHHMLDVLEPDEPIDAARYAQLADQAIEGVVARGAVPFVVGGTGLWLRALLRGLLELPPVDPVLRAQLEREWRELGSAFLHARLAEVDQSLALTLHPSDMVRVVRALEVHAQTGRALSELRAAHALGSARYRALTLVLDIPAARWRAGLVERIRQMLERGWIDEVRALVQRYGPNIKPLRSVGYRQILEGLEQGAGQADIEQRVLKATRLYGKRQRNWFRTDPSVDRRLNVDEVMGADVITTLRRHLELR